MKYLIVGLGNPGVDYRETRHNIGFKVLEALCKVSEIGFESLKLGDLSTLKYKGRVLKLLKPNTYMNLSGKSVNYWLQKEKIRLENILIITDDIALPFGKIRMRGDGSAGGHNGLKDIQAVLNSQAYARIRFGVGNQFGRGKQIDYVLGNWSKDEKSMLDERISHCHKMILDFTTVGLEITMSQRNNK